MYRVYVGNLDSEVTEAILNDVLRQRSISTTAVVVKRGYAFVDCTDSVAFDHAIQQLNGLNVMGSVLQVESSAISRRLRTSRIQISRLPIGTTQDGLLPLVSSYGPVQQCVITEESEEQGCTAVVDYESWQHARGAAEQLDELDYEGSSLKVELVIEGDDQSHLIQESNIPSTRTICLPLRILVPSDVIGAIIGRKGQTIRSITEQTKARIDVHSKESTGLMEKMVSIYGQPEQCSEACREILTIMQREAVNANRGDVTLRMLIDDRYCGRIIGREGKTVKKIREDTGTRISVSNVQEMATIYPDRVVAIRGPSIDSMSNAEASLSAKLRECHQRDYVSMARPPLSLMTSSYFPPTHTAATTARSPSSSQYAATGEYESISPGVSTDPVQPSTSAASPPLSSQQHANMRETCRIAIPNYAVGAIIGAAGANIKRIIRDSNAFVTVEPRRDDQNPSEERIVTIKGNSDACWRASYFIFEKMKLEGFAGAEGDVRLRTVITIPQSAAGRIVGKGGKNVREIQRSTGSIITLPSVDASQQFAGTEPAAAAAATDVQVEVFGNFIATQSAHNRIRSMVYKSPTSTTSRPVNSTSHHTQT